ncbi:hypothetical protein BDR26DRAFT_848806 [Obelidium mucronatum]|nr:hypothetical protein BDR26DRAFT_848806 [Obelidium mucronatum]
MHQQSTTLLALVLAIIFQFPAITSAYPDSAYCESKNWDLGENSDPSPGLKLDGQQVYIKDQFNFCINLPDPYSPFLQERFGGRPTIVQAEGYVRAFCVGANVPDGAVKMPEGAIISAHVVKNFGTDKKRYMQIWGKMNCNALNINCQQSYEGAYDDGGQYDSVPYRNCGKEPYSGVHAYLQGNGDSKEGARFDKYVEQAGDGVFCMRVCEGGMEESDPCNAKYDTKGCKFTMGISDYSLMKDGYSFTDITPYK